jgi:hypothetical protein
VVPPRDLPKVLREYREPQFPEFAREPHNVWRLEQAFTTVMRPKDGAGTRLRDLAQRTRALAQVLDTACLWSQNRDSLN